MAEFDGGDQVETTEKTDEKKGKPTADPDVDAEFNPDEEFEDEGTVEVRLVYVV